MHFFYRLIGITKKKNIQLIKTKKKVNIMLLRDQSIKKLCQSRLREKYKKNSKLKELL